MIIKYYYMFRANFDRFYYFKSIVLNKYFKTKLRGDLCALTICVRIEMENKEIFFYSLDLSLLN